MPRPTALHASQLAEVRSVSGEIAADNASLVDANYPVAAAFDARGFESVWVGVEIAGGSSPTATLEMLARDPDAADGSRWKSVGTGDTGALTGAALVEVRTEGRPLIFPRIKAVANATGTTSIKILVMPGKPRSRSGVNG